MTASSPQDGRQVLAGQVLARVVCTAVIDAPTGKVDLPEWLRTLPDREFQRCAVPDHKAVGYTVTDDGEPLTVMVETIGASLFVQHFQHQAWAGRTADWCRSPTCSPRPAGRPAR